MSKLFASRAAQGSPTSEPEARKNDGDLLRGDHESEIGKNMLCLHQHPRPILTMGLSVVGQYEHAREAKRQIGITTATFLIVNRVIGTGIFATPGSILALSGSVGLSLFIWVAGMLIAAAGTAVYLEFGTAIPKNGGEKNYLEFVYRKPAFLATCLYAGYVVLLGWAAGNSVIFGYATSHYTFPKF